MKVLNAKSLDTVSKNFDLNCLRVLASRYLFRNNKNEIIESPTQMFERVAILVGVGDIRYDTQVFDKSGNITQNTDEARTYLEKLDNFDYKFKIGEYFLNKWHFRSLINHYVTLANKGQMKVSFKDLLTLIAAKKFDNYADKISEYFELMSAQDFLPNSPTMINAGGRLGQLSHARVHFDANRYSVPPEIVGKTALLRADAQRVRVLYQGREVASHPRCYERGQLLCLDDHRLAALKLRSLVRARDLEDTFDALGSAARQFHLELRRRPVKTAVHLRRVLNLVRLYGRADVLAALTLANQYGTYDAAYVQTLVLQERRRRELPSPTPLRPQRLELIDEIQLDEPDPAAYDRLCQELPNSPERAPPDERRPMDDLPSEPF